MKRLMIVSGIVALAALMIPGTSFGARFGAKLRSTSGNVLEPSNSVPKHKCTNAVIPPSCTRVQVGSGTGFAGGNITAPKTGTITKIKLVAGSPGQFVLGLAKSKNVSGSGGDAKFTRQGPIIHYAGNGFNTGAPNQIEVFKNLNLHVVKGENIAIRAKRTSVLRCDSGGTRQLLFTPALLVGGGFTSTSNKDGCTLMIQAVVP